jgi:hypothetical protein
LSTASPTRLSQSRCGVSKAVAVYAHPRGAIIALTLAPGTRIDKIEICAGSACLAVAAGYAWFAEERLVEVDRRRGPSSRASVSPMSPSRLRPPRPRWQPSRRLHRVSTVGRRRPERLLDYQTAAVKAKDIDEPTPSTCASMLRRSTASRCAASPRWWTPARPAERARRLFCQPRRATAIRRRAPPILGALGERSAQRAAAAMGAHLDEGMSELRRYAAARPDLFEA